MSWDKGLDAGSSAYLLASTESRIIRALAGPGSGKSFAIKRRIARLLESGANPERILAITFTRTSAHDLKREISSIVADGSDKVHTRTLHSHALRILMQADVLESTRRNPRMVIDHEILPALKDIEREEYGGIVEEKKLLDLYLAAWACLQNDDPGVTKHETQEHFESDIVSWLKAHQGILVGEVIPVALDFLRNNPAYPEIGKYDTILVDEYQDLNRSEQEFINLIRGNADMVIVGDDDQSIYGFKFAHPEGIKEVEQLYGECHDVPFDECRRCPSTVTKMASELISKNTNRTLGDLKPFSGNHEGLVDIIQWDDYDDEIAGLCDIIQKEIAKGKVKPEDILILAPRRRVGYKLRDRLLAMSLPVKSYFREEMIKKDPVKRAYSLLNFLANNQDIISLRFLLGVGSQDYRKNQYRTLQQIAEQNELSIFEVLQKILKEEISTKGLTTIILEFRKIAQDLSLLKQAILDEPETAFEKVFMKKTEDEIEFYELNEIYKSAVAEVGSEGAVEENFDTWIVELFKCFQEGVALPESPEDIDHIRIMSLHASKGLSAKFVIICSMIDPLMPFFPYKSTEPEDKIIEEQRRLFYVAITRCKSSDDYPGRLIISSFVYIRGREALQMGLNANEKTNLRVRSTRYMSDFKNSAPKAIHGNRTMF